MVWRSIRSRYVPVYPSENSLCYIPSVPVSFLSACFRFCSCLLVLCLHTLIFHIFCFFLPFFLLSFSRAVLFIFNLYMYIYCFFTIAIFFPQYNLKHCISIIIQEKYPYWMIHYLVSFRWGGVIVINRLHLFSAPFARYFSVVSFSGYKCPLEPVEKTWPPWHSTNIKCTVCLDRGNW